MCELGSTSWLTQPRATSKAWLDDHPREVVTLFVQDEVSPVDTAGVIEAAGLEPYVYTPADDGDWPTLGEMIDAGTRLVVLMENRDGGDRLPVADPGLRRRPGHAVPLREPGRLQLRPEPRRRRTPRCFLVNHWIDDWRRVPQNSAAGQRPPGAAAPARGSARRSAASCRTSSRSTTTTAATCSGWSTSSTASRTPLVRFGGCAGRSGCARHVAMHDDVAVVREPSLADALVPLGVLAVLIAGALALFGLDALDGPIQVALLLCCAVAALIAMKNGHPFAAVQEAGQGCGRFGHERDLHPVRGRRADRRLEPERHHPDARLLRHPGPLPGLVLRRHARSSAASSR